MKMLIKNAHVVDAIDDYTTLCDVFIKDGFVEDIGEGLCYEAEQIIDADGFTVMPGFVDMHCHLRQPGFENKETVASGTKAAARGGYTTICCMPNTKPVIDNQESLSMLMDIIKEAAVVKVLPIAAISINQKSEGLTDMVKLKALGAVAFSDDGQPVSNNELMLSALKAAKEHDLLLIDHCEDKSLVNGGVINQGKKSEELGLLGISNLTEEQPIARDVMLAKEAGYKIHIAHVSTEGSADIIRKAKEQGTKVTCEVTPHHLALSEDIIKQGYTDCKVNPPLRTKKDIEALKLALEDGTIDAIATDHAPHHKEEKGNDFYKAPFGISGIETSFSVCYTELVESGLLSLKELSAKMSQNPSNILGIAGGRLTVGATADIVIVDLNKTVIINKNEFYSKGKNTPFHERSYKGEVVYTIVNGQIAYKKGEK